MKEICKRKWYHWNWDYQEMMEPSMLPYLSIKRWRKGLITFYRIEAPNSYEWRLYLPFNISIGIAIDKHHRLS